MIEAMAKHLPPSAATLDLLDLNGGVIGAVFSEGRGDLRVVTTAEAEGSVDAVVAADHVLDPPFLARALRVLRPGGRLIVTLSDTAPDEGYVRALEDAGYRRILVEAGTDDPFPVGVLARGEKPHVTEDTLERIRVAADDDAANLDMATYRGRYVYLLIKQTPNKPVWAMRSDEAIHWDALTVGEVLLAFTSLPKAVNFMQPAVLSGWITGMNKVAKFKRETVAGWGTRILLNPALERLAGITVSFRAVDPHSAEKPDE